MKMTVNVTGKKYNMVIWAGKANSITTYKKPLSHKLVIDGDIQLKYLGIDTTC